MHGLCDAWGMWRISNTELKMFCSLLSVIVAIVITTVFKICVSSDQIRIHWGGLPKCAKNNTI